MTHPPPASCCMWRVPSYEYGLQCREQKAMRSGSPASTDVDVEHGREASKTDDRARRAAPMPAPAGAHNLYEYCMRTTYASTARVLHEYCMRTTYASTARVLHEYCMRTTYASTTPATPATICRIDLPLVSCIEHLAPSHTQRVPSIY
jgi:hypothetical protein